MASSAKPLDDDDAWYVAGRWQQLDGEYRANHLRILSLVAFYVVHLAQHYRPVGLFASSSPPDDVFHLAVTVIVVGWLLMSLAIDVCLRQRTFPGATPYITTGMDLVLLTAVLCLGGGQRSPLVLGYFLILVMAAMRFSLPLVSCGDRRGDLLVFLSDGHGTLAAMVCGRKSRGCPSLSAGHHAVGGRDQRNQCWAKSFVGSA